MYNARPMIIGLAVFIGLTTFPIWRALEKAAPAPEPELDTPAIQQMPEKLCVEATPTMRARHMQLLGDWRAGVVRDGRTVYAGQAGKKYEMSLQKTCLKCHANKDKFCDQCHDYAGVQPDCWTCHIAPGENKP